MNWGVILVLAVSVDVIAFAYGALLGYRYAHLSMLKWMEDNNHPDLCGIKQRCAMKS